ncbi:hypothetical protein [Pleionea sediminis]|uniref:hypothetical protein n=1 Tax=Pleionea sediminis TaxID=2569479 RepID=UPI001186E5D4|nr:hypothetical protein [Pleionea sediminis]
MTQFTHFSTAFPHGRLREVFNGIWFVEGGWDMPVPLKPRISRSMTVIRHDDNSLTLVNSLRLSEAGLKELDKLGRVERVIRLASMHGADDAFFRERYNAKVFALKGTRYIRGLTADTDDIESYFEPDEWFDEKTGLPIPDSCVWVMNSPKLKEACVLLQRDGGILLAGDMLHNTPVPSPYTNRIAKIGMRLFGLAKSCNIGVGWWMMTKPSGSELLDLLSLPFQHVLPIHGEPVIGDAKAKYQPAIERYAKRSQRKKWRGEVQESLN